jgi:hypothetical protein
VVEQRAEVRRFRRHPEVAQQFLAQRQCATDLKNLFLQEVDP